MGLITHQLLWLLSTLWEGGENFFFCRMPFLVDELDRLMTAESRVRDLTSPYLARRIGELSILVAECLRQIETYQPWANGFENALVSRTEGIERDFAKRTQNEIHLMAALSEPNVIVLHSYGDPSDKRFYYPV